MFFKSNYKNCNEPILEPIFRQLRFGIALKDLKILLNDNSVIFDYGCGPEAKFYSYLLDKNIRFKKYYGFDPLLRKDIVGERLLITSDWKKIEKQNFDLITMFAVLEHLSYPDFDFGPILRQLKDNGHLILTTPTKLAKPVLEFLSYKLGIVSSREIKEHKHYYDFREIDLVFNKHSLRLAKKKIFELGMNNYVH